MANSTPVDVFTISSNNYLGMTRVFAESYLKYHPGATVYVCLVDHLDERVPYDDFPFTIILAQDLDIPGFRNFAFRYDILELNTAVKPFVIKFLRDEKGLDRVFYFDPDIMVLDRLTGLEDALSEHLAVLTPHLTMPLDNTCRPPERVIGMCGIYNLGFLGLQLNDRTESFLDWWCDRLHRFCINDLSNGMFVDQSWMDFAPAYLETVAIVRDPIFNIAYWNLPHRFPTRVGDHWEVNGKRVGFFHFSGVDLKQIDVISKHQDRLDLWSRPELRPLFVHYTDLIRASGQEELKSIPYAYHCFKGTDIPIPRSARVALQETDPDGLRWPDPFDRDCDDPYFDWLVEPLWSDHGVTNRAALFMWRERADVRDAFPAIDGEDLVGFMNWYLDEGADQARMHEAFVGPLRDLWEAHSDDANDRNREPTLADFDLGHPGAHADWLNEPAGGNRHGGALVTRLALLIHGDRADVQALYPDPLGRDRLSFTYWFVVHGCHQHGLHPDLVKPARRSLPMKSRLALALKRVPADGRGRGSVHPSGAERSISPRPIPTFIENDVPSSSGIAGVNLVGYFEGERGARNLSRGFWEVIRRSGLPCVEIALDHELPDLMTSEQIRHLHGAPFPVTVLDLAADRFKAVASSLPFGTRRGRGLVGYLSESPEFVHPDHLNGLDEVWVPTRAARRFLADRVSIPVRCLPYLPQPNRTEENAAEAEALGLDTDIFWFGAMAPVGADGEQPAISAAIECIRRLSASGRSDIGLCLLALSNADELARQVDHLPVRVLTRPWSGDQMPAFITACDGLLGLSPTPRFDAHFALARRLGKRVVARRCAVFDDGFESPGLFAIDGVDVNCSALVGPATSAMIAVVDQGGPGTATRLTEADSETAVVAEWMRHVERLARRPSAPERRP